MQGQVAVTHVIQHIVWFSHHEQKAGSDFLYIIVGWAYDNRVVILEVMSALCLSLW